MLSDVEIRRCQCRQCDERAGSNVDGDESEIDFVSDGEEHFPLSSSMSSLNHFESL